MPLDPPSLVGLRQGAVRLLARQVEHRWVAPGGPGHPVEEPSNQSAAAEKGTGRPENAAGKTIHSEAAMALRKRALAQWARLSASMDSLLPLQGHFTSFRCSAGTRCSLV